MGGGDGKRWRGRAGVQGKVVEGKEGKGKGRDRG